MGDAEDVEAADDMLWLSIGRRSPSRKPPHRSAGRQRKDLPP